MQRVHLFPNSPAPEDDDAVVLAAVTSQQSAQPSPSPAPSPVAAPTHPASPHSPRDDGPTLVSRIKDRLPLVDYASRNMKLKSMPGNSGEHAGNCPSPDHDDNNASFYVSSKTNAYYCHGCGISGNVIHLYGLFHGMDYGDAKTALGRELGVFNERATSRSENIMLDMARKYVSQLQTKADAIKYLVDIRKLSLESIEKFGLGFCWGRECQYMTPAQKAKAVENGILRLATETAPEKSFMAGRITFPVRDKIGRVVGFGGRFVPSEYKTFGPKYINTPETANFKKSELLYGAYEAAPGISKAGYAVVLEGYMDVIATHQHGVTNTVAVMGASANESTFANLWSMTTRVVFCLDGDIAGDKGALRSVLAAAPTMPPECEIAVATLPPGVDPDEYVIEHGGEAFKKLCENATPLSRYLMTKSAENFDLSYAEGRAAFIAEGRCIGNSFAMAPDLGEQIVAEAKALSAAGLARYALGANGVGDSVESNLIQGAIEMLQVALRARESVSTAAAVAPVAQVASVVHATPAAAITVVTADTGAPVPSSSPSPVLPPVEPEARRTSRRP